MVLQLSVKVAFSGFKTCLQQALMTLASNQSSIDSNLIGKSVITFTFWKVFLARFIEIFSSL